MIRFNKEKNSILFSIVFLGIFFILCKEKIDTPHSGHFIGEVISTKSYENYNKIDVRIDCNEAECPKMSLRYGKNELDFDTMGNAALISKKKVYIGYTDHFLYRQLQLLHIF